MNANARGRTAADASGSERQEGDGRPIEPVGGATANATLSDFNKSRKVSWLPERQLGERRDCRKAKKATTLTRSAGLIMVRLRVLMVGGVVDVLGAVLMNVNRVKSVIPGEQAWG
jgi:hypothetical protein